MAGLRIRAVSRTERLRSALADPAAHRRHILQTADQGTAALVNFGVNITVARIGGVVGLGQFNLPYALYLCAVAMQRAVLMEPMLASRDSDRVFPGAFKISVAVSCLAGAFLAVVGAVLALPVMLVLGASLPLLLLQDLLRYKHLRDGQPQRALIMDVVWLAATLSPILLPVKTTVGVELAWGIGAACGVALGVLLGARVRLRRGDLHDFREASHGISGATALDNIIDQFLWLVPVAITMQIVSVQLSGEYRIANTLMAPLGVIASSWTLTTYGRVRESTDVHSMSVLSSAVKILAISLAYFGLMLLAHDFVADLVFGPSAVVPLMVMVLVGLQTPVQSFEGQLAVWFKVNRVAANITVARAFSTIVIVGCVIVAVLVPGASVLLAGAVTVASIVHTVISLSLYRRQRSCPPRVRMGRVALSAEHRAE